MFFDERADEKQREALKMIFSGKAGGFIAEFAKLVREVKGMNFAPIKFDIAEDLPYWSAEIPGKVLAKAEEFCQDLRLHQVREFRLLIHLEVR